MIKRTVLMLSFWICTIYGMDGEAIGKHRFDTLVSYDHGSALVLGDRTRIWGYGDGIWSTFKCVEFDFDTDNPPMDPLLNPIDPD